MLISKKVIFLSAGFLSFLSISVFAGVPVSSAPPKASQMISAAAAKNALPAAASVVAVYAYDNSIPGEWVNNIINYNKGTMDSNGYAPLYKSYVTPPTQPINMIYGYVGDMEMSGNDLYVYPGKDAATMLSAYKKAMQLNGKGQTYMSGIVDGRIDSGYLKGFPNLTDAQLQVYANKVAAAYCAFDSLDDVQVDVEPYNASTSTALNKFYQDLSGDLRSKNYNCVNTEHPNGRSMGVFMFAQSAKDYAVKDYLGPNGYVVMSGYDLSDKPSGDASTPQQYSANFSAELKTMQSAGVPFMVAIPAAASYHEFEAFIIDDAAKKATRLYDNCSQAGVKCSGFKMYSVDGSGYINQVVPQLTALKNNPNYLGVAMWGFLGGNTKALPTVINYDQGEARYLMDHL